MPLNFPNSPSTNDEYSFGGKTWIYTGVAWRLKSVGSINGIPIGDTTPNTGSFTTLTVNAISANGSVGTNGQVLISNGTTVYWANSPGGTTVTAGSYLYFTGDTLNVNATSTSTASVVVARDSNQNFAANVVTVNSISAGNGQFSGPITGVTTLAAGNTTITGFVNATSTLASGNVTVTGFANISSTLAAGNTTVTGFINVSSTASLGNTTVTGFVNATSLSGNGVAITSINASSIDSGTLDAARLATSGVTANTYGNSSQIPVLTIDDKGRVTAANTTAVAGVTNVVYTESNTTLVVSTGDGSSFATTFGTANSTYNGFIKVVDSISNTSAVTAAAANSVKVAYDAALNAYSNATTYASNADNISSGTLNTARLPVTANVSTAINVGANVNLTVDRVNVGNSTVNTFITATGIETDGTLNVANTVTFANGLAMSNTIIANVADPVDPRDAANKAYVDAVTEGLHIHPSVNAATSNTLTNLSGGSVTYNNGTSGVGATLTLGTAITTIDGVTLTTGSSRVLVKDEANTAHNGIYLYSNSTVLTRSTDYDTPVEMAGGDFTFVTSGTIYNNTGWVQVEPITTVGTDPIVFIQFSGAGVFTAGDYLFLDGSEFNVNATSNSTASVVVARDTNQSFAANVVTVNSISAGNGQFSGPVTGITTLDTGNTTVTGFANISSTLAAGNTTITGTLSAGNTTITGFANVTSTLAAGNTTVTGFANVTSTLAAGNTTVTGFINVSSTANIGGILSARANVVANGQLIVSNTASLGNTTITGFANVTSTLDAGNTTVTGFINVSSTAALGNTTITGFANVSTTLAAGNTTITGFANVTSTLAAGNTTITGFANVSTTLAAGNTTITGFANVTSTLAAGNTTITGFANVSSAVHVGNSTSNVALSGGTVSVSGYQQSFVTHTSSNTDLQTCDTFNASNFRSAQYFIQMTSGTDYHSINISLIHNGTDVFIAQYGEIVGNVSLGTFTSDVSVGNVILQVTPANDVTVIKAVRTLIET